MIDLDKFDPSRRREHEIRGEKFIFQCTDPYGHWFVHRPHGQMPPHLVESAFTEISYAIKAVDAYLATKQPVQPESKPTAKVK